MCLRLEEVGLWGQEGCPDQDLGVDPDQDRVWTILRVLWWSCQIMIKMWQMCLVWISKGCTIQGQHRPKAGELLPMKVQSTQHPTELAFFDIFWLFLACIVPKACHCQWRFHQLSIRLRRLCSSLDGVVGQLIQTTLNLLKFSGHPIDWVIRFISTRQ